MCLLDCDESPPANLVSSSCTRDSSLFTRSLRPETTSSVMGAIAAGGFAEQPT